MEEGLILLTAALIAFLCSLALMPLIIRLSHQKKWYDIPDKRKIHKGLIPRLGGVGIFLSTIFAAVIASVISVFTSDSAGFFQWRFLSLFIGFAIVHYVGLFDDFLSLRALPKLLLQILAGAVVTAGGFLIESIPIPYIGVIKLGILAYPVTILWLVALTNAMNLVDGMDGLAGGISAFAALAMGIIALIQGQLLTALLAFILFGSIIGFLLFNFPPAKSFMGDSGSLFLGFSLAVIPLMGISKAASISTLMIPITLFTIPIIDTFTAILRRLRQRRSIASPDKDHIHHKLLYMGFNERKILLFIYSFCLYLSIIAITSVILPKETNVYLIIVVWIGSLLGYYFLDFLKEKKKTASALKGHRKDSSSAS